MLWLAFLIAVAVDFFYIRTTRSVFEAMYEGLGSSLPGITRFFLDGRTQLAALAAVPVIAVFAGIAWRLRAWAGIAVLTLAVLVVAGWGITYMKAMSAAMEAIHGFDDSLDGSR